MHQTRINPYQPVEITPDPIEFDADREVAFRMTTSRLKHAEAHLLIRVHWLRLIVGSLTLIMASGAAMFWSASIGAIQYVVASVASLAISSTVYLGLVHQSKMRIRDELRAHGMVAGAICSIAADDEGLTLSTPTGVYRWPTETVKFYRVPRGFLLSPARLLPIFVPKRNQSSSQAYDTLRSQTSASHK